MKKSIKNVFALCLISGLLVACGGGGSGDNVSSSGSSSNSGSSTNTGSSNQVITTSCSTTDSGKTYLITTSGCVVTASSNTQTGVCTSATTIKLLTGTGFTKEQVVNQGSSFTSSNGVTINGITYKCA